MGEVKEWLAGSFNVCIPVYLENSARNFRRRVLIRFPFSYKVGEIACPGNANEKLRCQLASIAWIQENHPQVPIPYFWGFGFQDGYSFTTLRHAPLAAKFMWYLRQVVSFLLSCPRSCRYVRHQVPCRLNSSYMIMDYIEESEGRMLSKSWEKSRHDPSRRKNLFKDLSRIILAIAQAPLPRIGSFTIDDSGVLRLTNRPLTLRLQHLENENIPTNIDRGLTYTTTDTYMSDLLSCHDNRLRYQPNAVNHQDDGRAQMAALPTMRTILAQFTDRTLHQGPFILGLADLHQSNIFVDRDWNITHIVDLEWTCSRPIEMIHPPHWITNRAVDQLEDDAEYKLFEAAHGEFLDALESEERSGVLDSGQDRVASPLSEIMREGWGTGKFWYHYALDNPKGLFNLFLQHIQPRYGKLDDSELMVFEQSSLYWSLGSQQLLKQKIQDKKAYDQQLHDAFNKQSDTD